MSLLQGSRENIVDISLESILQSKATELQQGDIKPITRFSGSASYQDFFKDHLLPNVPCLISSELTSQWRSRVEWVDEDGKPNFEFLRENYGGSIAPVADCNEQYFNAQRKQEMTVKDFLDYWEKLIEVGHPSTQECLYLKDWHFSRDFPESSVYEWPKYFSADWLNEYWDTLEGDDYKFVYMGPKGSWTPLHVDVFTSYSWSTNVCGSKKWVLFPPGCESNLRMPSGHFPYQKELTPEQMSQGIVVDQLAGETIFVPTGWHHQVWNTDDTISINHNWLNGCCIINSWNGLKRELLLVEKELADCKDMNGWEEQCQIVLKATAGINVSEFLKFLSCIAGRRIRCIKGEDVESSGKWRLGRGHAYFDLKKISELLKENERYFGNSALLDIIDNILQTNELI